MILSKLLLKKGVDPNHQGIDGGTPLHRAALFGRVEMTNELLTYGAKVDAVRDIHTAVKTTAQVLRWPYLYLRLPVSKSLSACSKIIVGRVGCDAIARVLNEAAR